MSHRDDRVIIIIQARMQSTRLPGKVLMPVLGQPLLFYLIERVQRVKHRSEIVIATSDNPHDDPIAEFCREKGITLFRGKEEDVLDRYFQAARQLKAEVVVRITADCPLIDPEVVDRVIQTFLETNVDYASNTLTPTYPRGMDTEVFSMEALEKAATIGKKASEREHVTLTVYRHPEEFSLLNVPYNHDRSQERLTVDTQEDFALIKTIIETLYPKNPEFTLEDILSLLDDNPELSEMNRHIVQKTIEEN